MLAYQRSIVYGRRRQMVEGDRGHILSTFFALGDTAGPSTEGEVPPTLSEIAETKIKEVGEDAFWETVRRVILHTTDTLWVEHIDTMEHMRQSVGLRSYGQREPLVEYKKEATKLFREMEMRFKDQVIAMVSGISRTPTAQS